ncbi:piwi domain-containing protein [Colletotrichum cuscutae]|uniref:Piwi domain-containing protein n=1 Tax=Colletotrichum cuscutae TaxID=1209917 RepID=A0AAI9U3M9_9PEZI|nr:piwi domain-containing protein [Colletotrichum cuscutae]
MADARHGGRGQSRGGRGRSDGERGGRGGRGSFSGGRGGDRERRGGSFAGGGSGDRGHRGGRGGRGGFVPRRDAFESEPCTFYGQGSVIPQPDIEITALEDSLIKSYQSKDQVLVKKMGVLKLTDSTVSLMPRRPAYGTKGKQVIVWANYFRVSIEPAVLYR